MRSLIRSLVLMSVMPLVACSDSGPPPAGVEPQASSPERNQAGATVTEDWQAVGEALGIPGKSKEGGVYRISMARSDLDVSVGDVKIRPSFALGSYAAFLGQPDDALVVGDLVLLEEEVNPVLTRLQDAGLAQTALHRHLLGEEPKVMYMHYTGRGNAVELARGIRQALEVSATPLEPGPSPTPTKLSFDTSRLDQIIGYQGEDKGGVWGYSIGRAETVTMDGVELPPSSGVATALNFQDLGEGRAAINGDFAMTPEEVGDVLASLRDADIAVQATHQHMLTDEPHVIYSHFWATGNAVSLAEGLRGALEHVNNAEADS